jgi:hypothetical protein
MSEPNGWLPYDQRTHEQQMQSDSFKHATPGFGEVAAEVDIPKHALLYDLEVKATGKLLNRIWQMEGSCVGAAGARAYSQSMCGDIVHRNTQEEVKDIFPWATWGIGRRYAGMNRRGAGSYGAAQAKAVAEWGMLAADDQRLPQPTNRDGWLVWSAKIELDYSYPKAWPIAESELAPSASEHQMGYVSRITSWNDLQQAFAQGYGVTCASMFGTRPVVTQGFLVGEWNTSWAHQMSWAGYYTHDTLGELVAVDNQWGERAHPACPFLSQKGVRGSFWIRKATVIKLLSVRDVEIYAHGNSEDWPKRVIDWDAQGMG